MPPPNPVSIFAPPLNEAGLRWITVGSIAASAYGEFRVTNDVDLVLVMNRGDASQLARAFPDEEFYRPPLEVMEVEAARAQRGHFNLIHHQTGFKADVYLAGRDPLSAWALANRRQAMVAGTNVWLAPPEHVVIGKLEFYREGGSEKHLRDIRAMLAVTPVDRACVERETARRGLIEQWQLCLVPA